MDELDRIQSRKADHVRVCLDPSSQFDRIGSGFDDYHFIPNALPELALADVDLSVEFLGKRLAAPFLISSMTGGLERGARINRHLAEGAAAAGIGMGVGSQRIALEHPEAAASFEVRRYAPDILLFANFGAVQLNYGFGAAEARAAVDMIGADGLFLHLNALQEAVQPEGQTNFRGLLDRIESLAREVPFPLLVKECGAGIAPALVAELAARGVAAIDVSGAGGTNWARVEGQRAEQPAHRALGEAFKDFGLPTAIAVREGRLAAPSARLIASGGIRSGLDAAKALALGADLVSFAQPVLGAALESGAAVAAVLEGLIHELRVACFCLGASDVRGLRTPGLLRTR